ncbi:voltage-gated potassium channel [Aureococcus anophagefferens]|nr:voltage-gated potassium channel [Aureococcus anophagefferens]
MVADPRKTQPRCEVSSACAGMMLTLRANFGKRFEAHAVESKNVVPFRMWLGRGIIVTARGAAPDEGSLRMPALSRRLDAGAGPRSAVISEITSITADSVEALEDEIFELKARLQREALAGAHRPGVPTRCRRSVSELMPLRYAAITMRRHEVPELAALQTVVRLSGRPQQRLFADADSYELREAEARQEALVESLHATIAAGEALQNEASAPCPSTRSPSSRAPGRRRRDRRRGPVLLP